MLNFLTLYQLSCAEKLFITLGPGSVIHRHKMFLVIDIMY